MVFRIDLRSLSTAANAADVIPNEREESTVHLRTLRFDDLDYLYRWENDPEVWQYGDCGADALFSGHVRFSREELRTFIENQQLGLEANEQLRLVICRLEGTSTTPIGFIDLFDYDPVARTAAIGILICDPADRRRGYGRRALTLALDYAHNELGLSDISCVITPGNPASEALFTNAGFCANQNTWTHSLTQ